MNNKQSTLIEFLEKKEQIEILLYLADKYSKSFQFCISEVKRLENELEDINVQIEKEREQMIH